MLGADCLKSSSHRAQVGAILVEPQVDEVVSEVDAGVENMEKATV